MERKKKIIKIGQRSLAPGVLNYLNEMFGGYCAFSLQNGPTTQATSYSRAFLFTLILLGASSQSV